MCFTSALQCYKQQVAPLSQNINLVARIIAGYLKNKLLKPLKLASYKPTTSIVREAIFNVLFSLRVDLNQSSVLDLFACSGSLAFEAMSRGSPKAVLVDQEKKYIQNIEAFIKQNSLAARCLRINALNLPESLEKFNLVFIDPPYEHKVTESVLEILHVRNWLHEGAHLVCETHAETNLSLKAPYSVLREKRYGKTKVTIAKYKELNKD